jgi:hypothetical protein
MPKDGISSPEEFFGFQMGADKKLARWDKIVKYFQLLAKTSDKIKVVELGKSTEGNPFLLAIITSSENMRNLDKIQAMSWRIAHPKGLSKEEAEDIIGNGKTVVAMTMSIHASEVGGAQMAPELAYELITSEEPTYQRIRESTVSLLFPSFNPDGNILVVDWYNKYLGTEYEAGGLPWLYHKYTGHDNNRDAFSLTQVESQMVSRVLYQEWFPQAYIDYHHMGSYSARFYIPPFANPVDKNVDPLIWTEQQLYGAQMMVKLEAAGKMGIENAATYPGEFMPTFNYVPCWNNICGMLTESASARLASPVYVHYHQLTGSSRGRPEYNPQVNFPHPWPGGWWRLRDVVEQQKISALATLEVAANNREMILRNMYLKATRSIRKGEEEPPYAFIVPLHQTDLLTAYKLLRILQGLAVEINRANKSFTAGGITYPSGTHVIFLSQTARPFLLSLLQRTFYRESPWTKRGDGSPLSPYDFAAQTLAEFMGVNVVEVAEKFEGDFEKLKIIEFPTGSVEGSSGKGYLLDGRLNDSFRAVNQLLKKGVKVFRADEDVKNGGRLFPAGSFYIPSAEEVSEALKEVASELHLTLYALDSAKELAKHEVKPLKIGMYQRYYGGNIDEGWTRWLLEQFEFPYTTVRDEEVRGGLKDKYDVLILPSDATPMITGEKLEEYYERRGRGVTPPKYPPEYRSGIKKEGVEKVKEFVEAGGTLLTFSEASNFALEELKVPLTNVLKDLKPMDFFCPGSTLKVKVDTTNPLAYGVSEDVFILFRGGLAFSVKPVEDNENYKVVISYPDDHMLQSGWLIGEQYLSRKAALIEAKQGKGRIVLYGFSPQYRAQTHGTFKFLFNALIG